MLHLYFLRSQWLSLYINKFYLAKPQFKSLSALRSFTLWIKNIPRWPRETIKGFKFRSQNSSFWEPLHGTWRKQKQTNEQTTTKKTPLVWRLLEIYMYLSSYITLECSFRHDCNDMAILLWGLILLGL